MAIPRCSRPPHIIRAISNIQQQYPPPPFPDRRYSLTAPLTPSHSHHHHHFINLTNGLEALPSLLSHSYPNINPNSLHFCRIQSTHCEQQQLERLITDADPTLLLYLALGHTCIIHDFGSRNTKSQAPRAIWYGLEFIRYVLNTSWNAPQSEQRAYLRGFDARASFDAHMRTFSPAMKTKLKYYGQFVAPSSFPGVRLLGCYASTQHDADFEYYLSVVNTYVRFEGEGRVNDTATITSTTTDTTPREMHLFYGGVSHQELTAWNKKHPNEEEDG